MPANSRWDLIRRLRVNNTRNALSVLYTSDYVTGWTVPGSNLGRSKRLFSPTKSPYRLWGPPSFLFQGHRGSFPRTKRPGREVYHSLPPSAKANNEWRHTSTPATSLHSVNSDKPLSVSC